MTTDHFAGLVLTVSGREYHIQESHNINNQTPINDAIYGLTFLAVLSLDRVVVCIGGSQVGVHAGVKVAVGSKSAPAVTITVAIWYAIEEPLKSKIHDVESTGVLGPRLLVVGYQKPPDVQVASCGPNVQFIVAKLSLVSSRLIVGI